ncbi:tau 95 subunit of transcription factor TFIIIC, partial [Linderina pennispora]
MVGGREKLAMDVTDDSKTVELRLRPHDPASHPVMGDVVTTRNILFKVTKRIKKSQLGKAKSEPTVTADAVAVIDKTVRFRRLANFQFLPAKDDPLLNFMQNIASVDLEAIKRVSSDEHLMAGSELARWPVPAPPIDVVGWPMPFGYKEESTRPPRSASYENYLYYGLAIQFADKAVPAGPTAKIMEKMKSVPQKLQDFARSVMDKYPVISRNAVDVMMRAEQNTSMRANMVMPLRAYVMRTGPWRS